MNTSTSYSLIKADQYMYSKYFATYRKNIWFRPSWLSIQNMMLNASDCYWVTRDNKRVAGISLTENTLGSFFVLPPFTFSVDIASFLKDFATEISEDKSWVDAYNVLPEYINVFNSMGFSKLSTRKCMIRPTEKIVLADMKEDMKEYTCVKPELEHLSSIILLMNEAYRTGTEERDLDTYQRDVSYFFEHNRQEELLEASSIIVQKETNEIVGICLVSLWEDLPLIYEIVVLPAFNNQGLGRYMICKAITHLEAFYPVIRLFVTSGNTAEYLYSNLGFLSGEETSHLVFRAETLIATQ